jgi:hypothetical protein
VAAVVAVRAHTGGSGLWPHARAARRRGHRVGGIVLSRAIPEFRAAGVDRLGHLRAARPLVHFIWGTPGSSPSAKRRSSAWAATPTASSGSTSWDHRRDDLRRGGRRRRGRAARRRGRLLPLYGEVGEVELAIITLATSLVLLTSCRSPPARSTASGAPSSAATTGWSASRRCRTASRTASRCR